MKTRRRIAAALARALGEDGYRRRARETATEIAGRPSPADIVKDLPAG